MNLIEAYRAKMARRKSDKKMERLIEAAAARGGECLAPEYPGMSAKTRWRCSEGHEWEAQATSVVNNGTWCPRCASRGPAKPTIEDMREIARSKGGECLSESYEGSAKKLRWRCASGHEWEATPSSVKSIGTWCKRCARRGSSRLSLDDMREIARSRGGECLSDAYDGSSRKLRWRCSEGHEWEAIPSSVMHSGKSGTWCPLCANRGPAKTTIDELREVAASRGGVCLSDDYLASNRKLRWRCSVGHEWAATPSSVMHTGTWCPDCSGPKTEGKARNIVEEASGLSFPKRRPEWLRRKNRLELDMHSEEAGLAIEWQGAQHYELVPAFRTTEADLADQLERDALKRRLCSDRGVLLLAVPSPSNASDARILDALERSAEEACFPLYGINREFSEMVDALGLRPRP